MFSLQAHVFQIDPETKKKWLPSSTSSVRVAFYHDPGKKTYRIIAIENNKVAPLTHSLCVVLYMSVCVCVLRRCEHTCCDLTTCGCKLFSQVQPTLTGFTFPPRPW